MPAQVPATACWFQAEASLEGIYNVSVNHRRQILFSTNRHLASWNDKTLQAFDKVIGDIQSRNLLADVTFTLYDRNAAGEIIKVQYKGA